MLAYYLSTPTNYLFRSTSKLPDYHISELIDIFNVNHHRHNGIFKHLNYTFLYQNNTTTQTINCIISNSHQPTYLLLNSIALQIQNKTFEDTIIIIDSYINEFAYETVNNINEIIQMESYAEMLEENRRREREAELIEKMKRREMALSSNNKEMTQQIPRAAIAYPTTQHDSNNNLPKNKTTSYSAMANIKENNLGMKALLEQFSYSKFYKKNEELQFLVVEKVEAELDKDASPKNIKLTGELILFTEKEQVLDKSFTTVVDAKYNPSLSKSHIKKGVLYNKKVQQSKELVLAKWNRTNYQLPFIYSFWPTENGVTIEIEVKRNVLKLFLFFENIEVNDCKIEKIDNNCVWKVVDDEKVDNFEFNENVNEGSNSSTESENEYKTYELSLNCKFSKIFPINVLYLEKVSEIFEIENVKQFVICKKMKIV